MPDEKGIAEIEAILGEYPWLLWHHCARSQTCHGTPGMPDFVIIGKHGEIWREVKPHYGEHPRLGQIAWKYGLLGAERDWDVWTPDDIASGRVRSEIEALL